MTKPNSEHQPSAQELDHSDLSKVTGGTFDAYLQIDGIKGESQEDQHKDWIERRAGGVNVTAKYDLVKAKGA